MNNPVQLWRHWMHYKKAVYIVRSELKKWLNLHAALIKCRKTERTAIRVLSLTGSIFCSRKATTLSENDLAMTAKHLRSSLWFFTVFGLL